MYFYTCSAGNPEGADWSMVLKNEKEFTGEQFQNLCEDAIVYAMEEEQKTQKKVFLFAIDCDLVMKKLAESGFSGLDMAASYYIEPYWGKENIKSEKLLKLIAKDRKE